MQELRRTVVPWGPSKEKPHQGGTPASQLLSRTRLMLLDNLPVIGYQYVHRTFTLVVPREISWREQALLWPLFSPSTTPSFWKQPRAPCIPQDPCNRMASPSGNRKHPPTAIPLGACPAACSLLPGPISRVGVFFFVSGIHTTSYFIQISRKQTKS